MTERLLAGCGSSTWRGEPAAMAGRILADLGADVVRIAPELEGTAELAWGANKASATMLDLLELYAGADIVLATPGWPGAVAGGPAAAPNAVWVDVTPFGARARVSAGERPTSARWRRPETCTRRAIPIGRRCAVPRRWRGATLVPRPWSPRSRRWPAAVRSMSTCRSRRRCSSPTWAPSAGTSAAPSGVSASGAQMGRAREIWPCQRRMGELRPAGRQGARPEPRADRPARGRRRVVAPRHRSSGTGPSTTTTRSPTRSCAPSRSRSPRTSPPARWTSSTPSPATPTSCSPRPTPHASCRVGATGVTRRSSAASATSPVSRQPSPSVRAADGEVEPARPRPRRHPTLRARPWQRWSESTPMRALASRPAGRVRMGGDEHPRVRGGRGGANRHAVLRRARGDGAAGRVAHPARLPARVRARARRTRTGSRAPTCSTR